MHQDSIDCEVPLRFLEQRGRSLIAAMKFLGTSIFIWQGTTATAKQVRGFTAPRHFPSPAKLLLTTHLSHISSFESSRVSTTSDTNIVGRDLRVLSTGA